MAKGKTIFEMPLDDYKANIDKKTADMTPDERAELLGWIQIGMLRRIGRHVMGLDSKKEG